MRIFLLALLAAIPAAAQTVSIPVVAPVQAPLGAGLAGAASLGAAPLPGGASVMRLPSLISGLSLGPVLTPVLARAPLQAAAMPAAAARPVNANAGALSAKAIVVAEPAAGRAKTARAALSGISAQVEAAKKERGGTVAAAPALSRAFDGAAVRAGEPAAEAVVMPSLDGAVPAREPPQRALRTIGRLKVGTYNLLNLFEKVGSHVPDPNRPGKLMKVSDRVAKEDWQLRDQAKAILESDLDIVSVEEVENIQALEDFNTRYLGGAYRTLLIEGNDERGIDVAFLVKKDLPVELEHRTHKAETWQDPILGREELLFSRDLPALIVRAQGETRPLFVLLGTHFKSKRDRPGDPGSETLRRAQVERTAEIVSRYRAEFGDDVLLMVAGDFNGDLNNEDSFAPLWKDAGLTNSLELGEAPVPVAQRVTHTFHPKGGAAHASQMDGILVSKGLKGLVRRSEVYRYRDAQGDVKPIPTTYQERSRNPSDHFPLLITLEFQPLVERVLGLEAGR